ncbi:hypothetical protein OPU71_16720 [Niveibacterium sp. 24ML]|uniref:hypothetical protein n=1 Tax=Niveibacterium sp. 24ML TaxID=2985512 RepID=UPI00227118A0|nr:hypothetical protein [Niveibacterium sp. 24ML]MCX9157769.1 hypothetical protein [Niveibacterium sp. 24ML]
MANPRPMPSGEFLNFSDIFSAAVALAEDDPIEHIIVLTFEFDEQQLLNLVQHRALEEQKDLARSGLKLLSTIRPVVFYDARKTKPFSRLPQFLELHPCKTAGFSCHHSKAYCIVTRGAIRLVVGSFNLTFTGIFRNREVLQEWTWQSAESADTHILVEWIDFLRQHYLTEAQASSQSALAAALATLDARTAVWGIPPLRPNVPSHLLASGYGERSGLDLLAVRWNAWFPDQAPTSLFAVSPFFDENPAPHCLAEQISSRFPTLSRLEIVTDAANQANLSRAHFGKHFAPDQSALRLIPESISADERARIERQGGNSIKDLVLDRSLHAKVLLLATADGAGIAYIGSANFSRKAWLGDNRELGFIERIDNAPTLREVVLRALSVTPGNHFDELPDLPPEAPPKPNPEEIVEDSLFPGFIDYVVLAPSSSSDCFRFIVHGTQLERIVEYDIHWADLHLTFADGVSQDIPIGQFRNTLLGGRTLEFRNRQMADRSFWFPFQYAGEIIADRQALMHSSSWDWLAFYLNPDGADEGEDPESTQWLDGRNGAAPPAAMLDVDREANCVIAMQRYLSLFSSIEGSFERRLAESTKVDDPSARQRAIRSQVIDPLSGLATLLQREPVQQLADRLFKLGELGLFVKSLAIQTPVSERTEFTELVAGIRSALDAAKGSETLAADYHAFVVGQLRSAP